jgi:hypothetical protein
MYIIKSGTLLQNLVNEKLDKHFNFGTFNFLISPFGYIYIASPQKKAGVITTA